VKWVYARPFDPEVAEHRAFMEMMDRLERKRQPFDPEVAEHREFMAMMERWRERREARRRIVRALWRRCEAMSPR
jgi:hypothetical protein